ncbi:MAG: hypothetical protein J6K61_05685 [Clostridia bacterium]|nr:hypothetical protein [Clostridia bacterium]
MKSRRIALVAFALAAVMTIGVGYAALSDTLNLNGTATLTHSEAEQEFNADVYFDSVGNCTNCQVTISDADASNVKDVATLTINGGLSVVGDKATAVIVIKNDSSGTATITPAHTSSTNFDIATDAATYTVAAGSTVEVTVTVTLKVTVNADINAEAFSISFVATSAG